MNIKTRLSIQLTLIVGAILLFFSSLIYYFSYTSQLNKFRQNLFDSAKNTAILLINVVEVDSTLLKKIQQSTISLTEEEIALTDSANNLIYGNNINYLTQTVMKLYAGGNDKNYFSYKEKDGVRYRHVFDNRRYNVYVLAFDKSRKENLAALRDILLWGILFSIWLSVLFSYFFARKAMKPVSDIIKSVREINSFRLNTRLNEGKGKDELEQMAVTFNQMLKDLETSFRNQEDFVSNASHELRTPLAVMISESDYLLTSHRNREEYIAHISGLISDLKNLNVLINSLLEMAQVNRDKSVIFSGLRIDEIVFNAIHQVRLKYGGRKIIPRINYPENDTELVINGNEGLLTIALKNILDNSCKFSNGDVIIDFSIADKSVIVVVSDKGVGIPSDEIDLVYKSFKRASNVKYFSGFGIGLSMVARILELHKIGFKIHSTENQGTQFEMHFNRIDG